MANLTKIILCTLAALWLNGCHGCTKTTAETKSATDVQQKDSDAASFSLSCAQIFAYSNHFQYRSEMTVTTKKGAVIHEDHESIEIVGAKPNVWLKKKTDSQHFIEIIAQGDTYFVKSGGKEFRRGADNNPLYAELISDGLNILHTTMQEFALHNRIATASEFEQKKVYGINPGPLAMDAPFTVTLPFKEIVSSDATGTFTVDKKSNLPLEGNLSVTINGQTNNVIALKASFSLELTTRGEAIAMPTVHDDDAQNYPVDVGRRFKDLLDAKESK